MHVARTLLAVGLLLAALSGSTARAQEASDEEAAWEAASSEVVSPEAAPELIVEAAPIEPAPEAAIETPIEAPAPEAAIQTRVEAPAPVVVPLPAAPAAAPSPSKVALAVIDNRFQPTQLSVGVGTTVSWTNNGLNVHTLAAPDGLFDSGVIASGQTFSYTFDRAGEFALICRQHVLNGMTARISVQ